MPCTYESRTEWTSFTDKATLQKALDRLDMRTRRRLNVIGLNVEGEPEDLNALRQAYQVEAQKATAKKRGWFVTETRLSDGKIKLTVRA